MKLNWQLLAELAIFLNLQPDREDVAATAFDQLGFPHPADYYNADAVQDASKPCSRAML